MKDRSSATLSRIIAGVMALLPLVASSASAQFVQQGSKLVGTGNVGGGFQGTSVAISADGNTAIVGGPFDSSSAGAAWVFVRNGGTWTQQGPKLVGNGGKISGQGSSVALSADGNTAVVGGLGDGASSSDWLDGTGAVWVFVRSNGVWSQQGPKLVGSGAALLPPSKSDRQGSAVAVSADGNTIVVGGYGDASGTGATWVFVRSNGQWTQQGPKLIGTGALGQASQGGGVAISADGNTIVVGGGIDADNTGAAWVFVRSNGQWTQQGPKLVGTGALGAATQGASVALSADGNTALVGGIRDNNTLGAAWVFTRSNGVWSQQGPKLVGSNAIGPVEQGFSVALSGDGNTAMIGPGYQSGAGAAWIFTRSGGVWSELGPVLASSDAAQAAAQGFSVALSGDGKAAIIGGGRDNNDVGAAWVFARADTQSGALAQSAAPAIPAAPAQTGNQPAPAAMVPQSQVAVTAAAFSPDGRLVVTGGQNQTLRLWDVLWGIPIHAFYGHQNTVTEVAYSPDGKHIASFGGNLLLWDATTGALVQELKGFTGTAIEALAFSTDGSQLLSSSVNDANPDGTLNTFIQVWNAATGALVKETPGPHVQWPAYAAFSPDRQRLAYRFPTTDIKVAGDDTTVWCTNPYPCATLGIWNVATGAPVPGFKQSMVPPPEQINPPELDYSFVFSPDGSIIIASYDGNHVRVINANTGALIRTMLSPVQINVGAVAVSPDAKTIAADVDGQVALWNVSTGYPSIAPATPLDDDLILPFLAFSADGTRLVSGSSSYDAPGPATFRIWNATAGTVISTTSILPEGNWVTQFFDQHYRASDGASPYLKITGANGDLPLAPYEKSFRLTDATVPRINPPVQQTYVCSNQDGNFSATDRIYACTDVIQSGWWTGNDLAWAYNDRCWAYFDLYPYKTLGNPGPDDQAIADCNEAVKRDPKNATAYFNLGNVYRIEAQYDQAIANYTQAIGLNPTFVQALNNRGLAYHRTGDYSHAIADYTAAIAPSPPSTLLGAAEKLIGVQPNAPVPTFAGALSNRGDAYLANGDPADAIADYTTAISIDPTTARPFVGRCNADLAQKNYQQAVSDCSDAIRLSPSEPGLYLTRMTAYQGLGRTPDAAADWYAAKALDLSLVGVCRSGPPSGLLAHCASLSPTEEQALKPKDTFKDCDNCPEMVAVQAGSFMMGSPDNEQGHEVNEAPQHKVTFAQPFAVSQFAVTFAEWDACFRDGGCNNYYPSDGGWGRGLRPAVSAVWDDVSAYVAWLSKKTSKPYRLVSEAELEYVTRAGTTTPYWWGSSISPTQANYDSNPAYAGPLPVDSLSPNPWGFYQVIGNVESWTADCWHANYTGAPSDGSAWIDPNCTDRALHGGSFTFDAQGAAVRADFNAQAAGNLVGFRVARTLNNAAALFDPTQSHIQLSLPPPAAH
jgi:formylglycine-generating enzyme required for sulfatase activity/WD40 repeat protein